MHLGSPDVEKLPAPDGSSKPWYVSVLKHESPKALAIELRALMADEKTLAAMVRGACAKRRRTAHLAEPLAPDYDPFPHPSIRRGWQKPGAVPWA